MTVWGHCWRPSSLLQVTELLPATSADLSRYTHWVLPDDQWKSTSCCSKHKNKNSKHKNKNNNKSQKRKWKILINNWGERKLKIKHQVIQLNSIIFASDLLSAEPRYGRDILYIHEPMSCSCKCMPAEYSDRQLLASQQTIWTRNPSFKHQQEIKIKYKSQQSKNPSVFNH